MGKHTCTMDGALPRHNWYNGIAWWVVSSCVTSRVDVTVGYNCQHRVGANWSGPPLAPAVVYGDHASADGSSRCGACLGSKPAKGSLAQSHNIWECVELTCIYHGKPQLLDTQHARAWAWGLHAGVHGVHVWIHMACRVVHKNTWSTAVPVGLRGSIPGTGRQHGCLMWVLWHASAG
jgi:hypothetical protein